MVSKTLKLEIEPMTEQAFMPFGEIWEAKENPPNHLESFTVEYHPEGAPTASLMWQPYQT